MFEDQNLQATPSAISSPESAGGVTHFASPDGQTPDLFGLEAVHANRSAPQGRARRKKTQGTCGQNFDASSPSAILQRRLESRLRQRLDVNGSPEYDLTWKRWDMPSGPPICALRASARRISGNGCGGWPTPAVQNAVGGPVRNNPRPGFHFTLQTAALLSGWPTPNANKQTKNSKNPTRMKENGSQTCLADAAWLAGWQSPKASDCKSPGKSRDVHLNHQAQMVGWPTPTSRDFRDGDCDLEKNPVNGILGRQCLTSSHAQTGNRGALNPAFTRWLMGYPAEWDCCGGTAMQSCRKSRRSS